MTSGRGTAPLLTAALVFCSVFPLLTAADAVAQDAERFWERIYEPDREIWDNALQDAIAALTRDDPDALREASARLGQLRPNADASRYFAALVDAREGRLDEAATQLTALARRGVSRDIALEAVWADLALLLTRLGRYEEALEAWDGALGANRVDGARALPHANRPIYLSNIAELYAALGDLDEAERHYGGALALDDRYAPALLGMAALLELRGERARARGYTLDAALADPGLSASLDDGAFFVPAGAGELRRGLVAEELGRFEEAARWFSTGLEAARGEDTPLASALRAAEGRARAQPPLLLAGGPAPLRAVSALAADPNGHSLALGDDLGRLMLTRLTPGAEPQLPILSGPPIVALAFDAQGRLMVGRDDGYVTVVQHGRVINTLGPYVLPVGARLSGLSLDGLGVLVGNSRQTDWALARPERPEVEVARGRVKLSPGVSALGPLERGQSRVTAAFGFGVELNLTSIGPDAEPSAERRVRLGNNHGLAFTRDGRHLVVASWTEASVYRVADVKVARRVELPADARAPTVRRVVVDEAGAAGLGPALLVFSAEGFRALRWEAARP